MAAVFLTETMEPVRLKKRSRSYYFRLLPLPPPTRPQSVSVMTFGRARAPPSEDEAPLHFLFGSPELLLLGFRSVSSVDFQLSALPRRVVAVLAGSGYRRGVERSARPAIIRLFFGFFSIHTADCAGGGGVSGYI